MRLPRFIAAAGTLVIPIVSLAQAPAPGGTDVGRADARIRALQSEADTLAGTARTLLTELRALEVERDLRTIEAHRAEAAATEVQRDVRNIDVRLVVLEKERVAQLPQLEAQLVKLYKRGTLGYARVLFGAGDVRQLGRASRVVAAMVGQDKRRLEDHQRTIATLQAERAARAAQARELDARLAAAVQARATAARALALHAARLTEIDSRRDLTAQYVGELQVARERLLGQLPAATPSPAAPAVSAGGGGPSGGLPLASFHGSLDWPVQGRLSGRFGEAANRLGGSVVRNGIEIAADDGTPVKAIHGGTVAHAAPYPGFGNLVILDHGSNHYSLYGYLGTVAVTAGQTIDAGTEVGNVGPSPAGPNALYFELRVDGRSVDPVQWLKPR
jgi:septal ring factor EnvC (AmiA/AmiB activator)